MEVASKDRLGFIQPLLIARKRRESNPLRCPERWPCRWPQLPLSFRKVPGRGAGGGGEAKQPVAGVTTLWLLDMTLAERNPAESLMPAV